MPKNKLEIYASMEYGEKLREFTLPSPPSVNSAYKNARKGRVKTANYNAWIIEAGWHINNVKPVTGIVQVIYHFDRPDDRVRDCANMEKCLSDLLVSHGIIEDDEMIADNRQRWSGNKGSNVRVEIFKENVE